MRCFYTITWIVVVVTVLFILLMQKHDDDMASVSADGMTQTKLILNTEYTQPNGSMSILLKEIDYSSKKCRLQYKGQDEEKEVWLSEGSYDNSGWWGMNGLFIDKILEDSIIITIRYALIDDKIL